MSVKNFVKDCTPPIVIKCMKRLLNKVYGEKISAEKEYSIAGRKIILNGTHALPAIQKRFKLYDKFLPELPLALGEGWIIDIGANVGDTLFAMINDKAHYLCIEPVKEFYDILNRNIASLKNEEQERIHVLQAMITRSKSERSMKISAGTAHSVKSQKEDAIVQQFTIDEVIEAQRIIPEDCVLVKVDTDGFDYDCILSGKRFFSQTNAALFYENSIDPIEHFDGYIESIDFLHSCGYRDFYIFDNVGLFMLKCDHPQLKSLLKYLIKVNTGQAIFGDMFPPHVYYFDILTCKEDKVNVIEKIIQKYTEKLK